VVSSSLRCYSRSLFRCFSYRYRIPRSSWARLLVSAKGYIQLRGNTLHPEQSNGRHQLIAMQEIQTTVPLLNLAGQFHSQLILTEEPTACERDTFPEDLADSLADGTTTQVVFPMAPHSQPTIFRESFPATQTNTGKMQ
jgi:hypothetical protein